MINAKFVICHVIRFPAYQLLKINQYRMERAKLLILKNNLVNWGDFSIVAVNRTLFHSFNELTFCF